MTSANYSRYIYILYTAIVVAMVVPVYAQGQDQLPKEQRVKLNIPYWTAVGVAAGGAALDGWTTISRMHPALSRQQSLATGMCNVEGGTPWLYGRKPSAGRIAGMMALETAGAAIVARIARKRARNRFVRAASLSPLIWEAGIHWHGVINNLEDCR